MRRGCQQETGIRMISISKKGRAADTLTQHARLLAAVAEGDGIFKIHAAHSTVLSKPQRPRDRIPRLAAPTGDGDMIALAGGKFEMGDENGDVMPPTLCSLWGDSVGIRRWYL